MTVLERIKEIIKKNKDNFYCKGDCGSLDCLGEELQIFIKAFEEMREISFLLLRESISPGWYTVDDEEKAEKILKDKFKKRINK